MAENDVILECVYHDRDRKGWATVTAKLDGEILACDTFCVIKAKQRAEISAAERPRPH